MTIGATGRFPDGAPQKPGDNGELVVALVANQQTNAVEMYFGKSVTWVSAGPDQIRQIALAMLRSASQLDGKILEVRTR